MSFLLQYLNCYTLRYLQGSSNISDEEWMLLIVNNKTVMDLIVKRKFLVSVFIWHNIYVIVHSF
jgi:hypothetical protein